ncbi:uncharacterized protein CLUP02_10311 [Colletotrichum lupini]|uniref:Uncharacterized protein n=1 Tax=Colletotrichum lupini TaxID=145971 RepID=A0A9Q8WJF6_9PEZI|nr:uncharacterized protein CLUP02_10311 [Colletotrichum lupini]UQC84815.1 hypothetical protein CLUP02_10311 [Colletotrichum lupini]
MRNGWFVPQQIGVACHTFTDRSGPKRFSSVSCFLPQLMIKTVLLDASFVGFLRVRAFSGLLFGHGFDSPERGQENPLGSGMRWNGTSLRGNDIAGGLGTVIPLMAKEDNDVGEAESKCLKRGKRCCQGAHGAAVPKPCPGLPATLRIQRFPSSIWLGRVGSYHRNEDRSERGEKERLRAGPSSFVGDCYAGNSPDMAMGGGKMWAGRLLWYGFRQFETPFIPFTLPFAMMRGVASVELRLTSLREGEGPSAAIDCILGALKNLEQHMVAIGSDHQYCPRLRRLVSAPRKVILDPSQIIARKPQSPNDVPLPAAMRFLQCRDERIPARRPQAAQVVEAWVLFESEATAANTGLLEEPLPRWLGADAREHVVEADVFGRGARERL